MKLFYRLYLRPMTTDGLQGTSAECRQKAALLFSELGTPFTANGFRQYKLKAELEHLASPSWFRFDVGSFF
jgi:hypothetical protein